MNKPQISNADIREEIRAKGLYLWQVAARLGVAESTFIRWMRMEMDDETKDRVRTAIREEETA